MDNVKVYFDQTGNTLTVWFADPKTEHVGEEIADDTVLMKDVQGRVIGFERLNYLSRKQQVQGTSVPVEVHMLSGEPDSRSQKWECIEKGRYMI